MNHEAAAVDPASGVVYLTEDRGDSLFYRFLPEVPGQLARGGKLQALRLREGPVARATGRTVRRSSALRPSQSTG